MATRFIAAFVPQKKMIFRKFFERTRPNEPPKIPESFSVGPRQVDGLQLDSRFPVSVDSLTYTVATFEKCLRLKALIDLRKSAKSDERILLDSLTLTSVDLGRPELKGIRMN